MTFGDKIKKMRGENNLTQDDLAEKVFVTRTAISKWETNAGYPSIECLKLLSKVFSVSLDDLVSNEYIQVQQNIENRKIRNQTLFAVFGYLFLVGIIATWTYIGYIIEMELEHILMIKIVGSIAMLCIVCAVFLFQGKGAWLIAGYNTMSKEQKTKYNAKALCRAVGTFLLFLALVLPVICIGALLDLDVLIYIAIGVLFVIILFFAFYVNTSKRFRS